MLICAYQKYIVREDISSQCQFYITKNSAKYHLSTSSSWKISASYFKMQTQYILKNLADHFQLLQ